MNFDDFDNSSSRRKNTIRKIWIMEFDFKIVFFNRFVVCFVGLVSVGNGGEIICAVLKKS